MKAASAGATLVILPECFNSPYSTASFPLYAEPLFPSVTRDESTGESIPSSPTFQALSEMARDAKVYLVGGTVPERDQTTGKIYNTSPFYSPTGTLLGFHRKFTFLISVSPERWHLRIRYAFSWRYYHCH
jgi:predicted amidohydrolase